MLALAGYATAVLNNAPGPLRGGRRRRPARSDEDDSGLRRRVAAGAGRGGVALRRAGGRRRRARPARGAHPRRGHGLGARRPGPLAGAAGDGDDDALYREAIERLARTRIRVELARARAALRRVAAARGRRVAAREHLRAAHEAFAGFGAEALRRARAPRARARPARRCRRRTAPTRDVLTPQEAQIARLAADGQTNPEIGAQLFISPRTVEYHLRKVFTKLGIGSRKELRGALGTWAPGPRRLGTTRGTARTRPGRARAETRRMHTIDLLRRHSTCSPTWRARAARVRSLTRAKRRLRRTCCERPGFLRAGPGRAGHRVVHGRARPR